MSHEQNPIEILITLNQMSDAISTMAVNVAPGKGFIVGHVSTYEISEFDELDDKGKPTGKTYAAPNITFTNGKEMELTVEENAIFRPIWNEKNKIDNMKLSFAANLFAKIFESAESAVNQQQAAAK